MTEKEKASKGGKQNKAKVNSSEQVWDNIKDKLILYIMEARDVAAKDSNGLSDPYVVIEHGKKFKKQTEFKKETLNPVWNQLYFLQVDPTCELQLNMWDKDFIGSDDFMGRVTLKFNEMKKEELVDEWFQILPRPGKEKKDAVSGQLHIKYYYSSVKATPTAADIDPTNINTNNNFYYKDYKKFFKPGDLIGFSNHGLYPSLTKILGGVPTTSVGLVVYLPNKWTQEPEPYVVELTRNRAPRMMDAFSETTVIDGVNIFRLFERFHASHSTHILHYALKNPINSENYRKIVEKVWDYHKRPPNFSTAFQLSKFVPQMTEFVKSKKHWTFAKKERATELYSFDFVVKLLREVNALDMSPADPLDILNSNCYHAPVLIRQRVGSGPVHYRGQPVQPPQQNSSTSSNQLITYEASTTALPAYSPPAQQSSGVVLSELETSVLMSLLDGVVLDGQLIVSRDEFRQKMIEKGIDAFKDDAKFNAFYKALDSDGDGKVDLRELICGFAALVDGSLDEKIAIAFKTFDRNNDNLISPGELAVLLAALLKVARNGQISDTELTSMVANFVEQIFDEYDKDGNSSLSFDEFYRAAHTNQSIGSLFLLISSVVEAS